MEYLRGGETLACRRGGGVRWWGVNILEDARHWIGLLQYNLSTLLSLYGVHRKKSGYDTEHTQSGNGRFLECICQLSRSAHFNFVGDGNFSERGWASISPPPSPAGANISIMMECTPKSGRCHSVCISVLNRVPSCQISIPKSSNVFGEEYNSTLYYRNCLISLIILLSFIVLIYFSAQKLLHIDFLELYL
jgi:hypothetical protein